LRAPTVIEQRGEGLGERLANAHADADQGHGVVQVGMDTPQVTVEDFLRAGRLVEAGHRTIGLADDGGWWLLGLPDGADASALVDVPMSHDDTGALTEKALGGDFEHIVVRRDMDSWDDAVAIAADLPISRLAAIVGALS
ncbi:MAG: DUF2064 domain-containing protein, partial [Aeromicrobium sp.]